MRYAMSNKCTRYHDVRNNTVTITGPCVKTGKPVIVVVPESGIALYQGGAYIQDAFPGLSADDREFLMSGYSKEGWDLAFPEEE